MAEHFSPRTTDQLWSALLTGDPTVTTDETSSEGAVRHIADLYSTPPPGAARERARQRVFDADSFAQENTMTASAIPISIPTWTNPVSRPDTPRAREPVRRFQTKWRWLSVAAAILLILAGLGGWLGYEHYGADTHAPAVVPANQPGAESDWPMYRGNAARTGSTPSFGPSETPVEYWHFESSSSGSASPAVVGTTVYSGSSDGLLRAIDALTGRELWQFQGDASLEMTPTVIDGVVYVPSEIGTLYAIDAKSGEERWQFGTATSVWAVPVERDGVLYAGSEDGNLYAIDAETGEERWHMTTGGPIPYAQALDGDVVYTGSDDGFLRAIDATDGSEVWKFDTGQQSVGAPAVADGSIYIRRTEGGVFAIDAATGEQRFLIPAMDTGNFTQASVAGKTIFLGGSDDNLYAFSTVDGSSRWIFAAGESFSASPAIANGIVYAAGDRGTVFAIDAETGTELWRYAAGGKVEVGPSIADGVIYVSTSNGNVVALGEPGRNPIEGTAEATVESSPIAAGAFDPSAIEVVWQTDPALLSGPGPVAVAPNGDVYVVDLMTDTVQIFGPDGAHIGSMGETGSGPGQFVFHRGQDALGSIDIDANGNIYVFDTYNNRVQKFAPDGSFLLEWGEPGSGSGDIQEATGGIDPRTGTIYVTDLNDRVQVFDAEGNFQDKWGSSGAGPAKFLKPLDVVVDSQGNVYVSQEENGPIQKIDPFGQYLESIAPPSGNFSLVLAMAIDANDNLFVANYNGNVIQIFDPTGTMIGEITEVPGEGTITGPTGLAFDADGNLYIADEGGHRVIKVTLPPLT